jgi:hypothetical protein
MAMGLEVELVWESDLVDVSAGLANIGLERGRLRDLFDEVPRDGLWRLIGSEGSDLNDPHARTA